MLRNVTSTVAIAPTLRTVSLGSVAINGSLKVNAGKNLTVSPVNVLPVTARVKIAPVPLTDTTSTSASLVSFDPPT